MTGDRVSNNMSNQLSMWLRLVTLAKRFTELRKSNSIGTEPLYWNSSKCEVVIRVVPFDGTISDYKVRLDPETCRVYFANVFEDYPQVPQGFKGTARLLNELLELANSDVEIQERLSSR